MKFTMLTVSALTVGCNNMVSVAGEYLAQTLTDYGPAIREIGLTLAFRGGGTWGMQRSYDRFHDEHLASLPKVKFYRKKQKIEIEYETAVADAKFLDRDSIWTAEIFHTLLREMSVKLRMIDGCLKKSDVFDVNRFHADVALRVEAAPRTLEEILELDELRKRRQHEEFAQLDEWEKLGIDWDDYHPNARALLDNVLFWSSLNDYMAHGNDTGADLLANFEKWNRRYANVPAYQMAQAQLRAWDIPAFDLELTDAQSVQSCFKVDWITLVTTDEAIIAAAFAAVKFRGCCDARTCHLALQAIQREHACIGQRGWQSTEDRTAALKLMAETLQRVPEHV